MELLRRTPTTTGVLPMLFRLLLPNSQSFTSGRDAQSGSGEAYGKGGNTGSHGLGILGIGYFSLVSALQDDFRIRILASMIATTAKLYQDQV